MYMIFNKVDIKPIFKALLKASIIYKNFSTLITSNCKCILERKLIGVKVVVNDAKQGIILAKSEEVGLGLKNILHDRGALYAG